MSDILLMKKAMEELDRGRELAIATVISSQGSTPRREGTKMIVFQDGSIYGTIGGGVLENRIIELSLEAIKEGRSHSVNCPLDSDELKMVCGGTVDIFIDVYKSKPKFLLVGGGHVGHAIYRFASMLDYSIRVFEDREEFLTKERFPLADELILGDMQKSLEEYPIDENTYIVITTRGHTTDVQALEAVVHSNAKYIGAMGSKKKIITMMKILKEKGISDEVLNKVYAPIGLKISGESPEEIAFSILAEIEVIKNNGELVHMKYYK